LLSSDVSINGDEITVCFIGKGGKQLERTVRDPLLAGILGDLIKRRGRKRLFALPKKNRPISAREVNEFLSSVGGAEISAKDFRTFRASAAALTSLLEHEGGESATAQRRAIQDIADRVSEELGNTRAVARSSYIHPEVIEAYENEALRPALLNGPPKRGLKRMEQALLRFLGSRRRPAPQPVPDEQRSS
jgi:DNA topoisomerase-1